jgi:hypothetical protein
MQYVCNWLLCAHELAFGVRPSFRQRGGGVRETPSATPQPQAAPANERRVAWPRLGVAMSTATWPLHPSSHPRWSGSSLPSSGSDVSHACRLSMTTLKTVSSQNNGKATPHGRNPCAIRTINPSQADTFNNTHPSCFGRSQRGHESRIGSGKRRAIQRSMTAIAIDPPMQPRSTGSHMESSEFGTEDLAPNQRPPRRHRRTRPS